MLTTKFSQNDPFNKYCYTTTGLKAKAGCIPIAIAQIICYHKRPADYNWTQISKIKTVNDAILNPTAADQLAKLINDAGIAVKVKYGVKDSEAYHKDVKGAFKKFGFFTSYTHFTKYSFPLAKRSLDSNRPVYVCGQQQSNTSEGHGWVVDGYEILEFERKKCIQKGREWDCDWDYSYANYVHCNWGWGGLYDGWFLDGNFTPGVNAFTANKKIVY